MAARSCASRASVATTPSGCCPRSASRVGRIPTRPRRGWTARPLLHAHDLAVPGDPSSAAFLVGGGADRPGSEIACARCGPESHAHRLPARPRADGRRRPTRRSQATAGDAPRTGRSRWEPSPLAGTARLRRDACCARRGSVARRRDSDTRARRHAGERHDALRGRRRAARQGVGSSGGDRRRPDGSRSRGRSRRRLARGDGADGVCAARVWTVSVTTVWP